MTPRPSSKAINESNPTPPVGTPVIPAGVQDHNFYLQSVVSIERSIGGIEASIKHLQNATEKHAEKIDTLTNEASTAKGMVKAFGIILSALGAVVLALLSAILSIISKHFK